MRPWASGRYGAHTNDTGWKTDVGLLRLNANRIKLSPTVSILASGFLLKLSVHVILLPLIFSDRFLGSLDIAPLPY
jgi:hypothetical protein